MDDLKVRSQARRCLKKNIWLHLQPGVFRVQLVREYLEPSLLLPLRAILDAAGTVGEKGDNWLVS